ncbi:MAG: hypothetical protein WB992_20355 [Bryobacteraceae bacterium]
MAYREYTTCVKPSNYVDLGFTYAGALALEAAVATGVVVLKSGGTASVVVVSVLIALFTALIGFCVWWLHGRLICLEGGQCVIIGMVVGSPTVEPLSKAGDDDASIFVLLAGGPATLDKNRPIGDYTTAVQGEMLAAQPAVIDLGRGYSGQNDGQYMKSLHSEFEGSGIQDVLELAIVFLALLIALLVLLLVPGGEVISAIITLLVILLGMVGLTGVIGALFDPFDPGNPDEATDVNYGTLGAGDLVVIQGRWIYDSLHDGWNEIHAIHACQKIGSKDPQGAWPVLSDGTDLGDPASVSAAVDHWCKILAGATGAEEGGNRTDPANQWIVHPLLDGCQSDVIV